MLLGSWLGEYNLPFLQLLIDKGANPHGVTNLQAKRKWIDSLGKTKSFYVNAKTIEVALLLMEHKVLPTKQKIKNSASSGQKGYLVCGRDLDEVLGQIEALLAAGVKPNEIDLKENKIMNFIAVEYLCRRGADVNIIGPNAAAWCDLDNLKALIKKGVSVDSTIIWNKKTETLLAHKIACRQYEQSKYLIENGASVKGPGVENAVFSLLLSDYHQKNSQSRTLDLLLANGFSFSEEFKRVNKQNINSPQVDFFRKRGLAW